MWFLSILWLRTPCPWTYFSISSALLALNMDMKGHSKNEISLDFYRIYCALYTCAPAINLVITYQFWKGVNTFFTFKIVYSASAGAIKKKKNWPLCKHPSCQLKSRLTLSHQFFRPVYAVLASQFNGSLFSSLIDNSEHGLFVAMVIRANNYLRKVRYDKSKPDVVF